MKPPPRPPGSEPTLRESKSALLDAARAAVAEQQALQRPGRARAPRVGQRVRLLAAALIAAAGGLLLLTRPAWLAGPKLPPETPAVQAASATLALVEAVSRIEAFRATSGRLPRALAEAGIRATDMGYEIQAGERFVVRLQAGDSVIVVRSGESLQPLVATAIRILERRT